MLLALSCAVGFAPSPFGVRRVGAGGTCPRAALVRMDEEPTPGGERLLEAVGLGVYFLGHARVPQKWLQVFGGKCVHLLEYRRPLFSLLQELWNQTSWSAGK